VNFTKNASWSIKKGIPELKDEIARIVFLNLWVDDKNVFNYQLNEPYSTLLKDRVRKFSRGDRTLPSPSAQSRLADRLWN